VIAADERWLVFRFDAPPEALPLAGQPCDGDSGGPVLIESNGLRRLAGIVSHKTAIIDFQNYHPGKYGSFSYQTRISQYAPWIESVIGASLTA
jgi:secreted trypsin-like serine protease